MHSRYQLSPLMRICLFHEHNMFYVFLFSPLALIMEWLAAAGRCSNEAHDMLLPSAVKTSGFFAPLNCFGQQDAINSSLNDIKFAAKKAATAADETFLVKPVNIPMPQALSSSRLLVVHNDAAAKAAAHLHLAYKIVRFCYFAFINPFSLNRIGRLTRQVSRSRRRALTR